MSKSRVPIFNEYLATMSESGTVETKTVKRGGKGRDGLWILLLESPTVGNVATVAKIAKIAKVEEIRFKNDPKNGEGKISTLATLATMDTLPILPSLEKDDGKTVIKKPAKEDSGLQKFKAGVQSRSKNTCRLCGQHFEVPLTISYRGGYICETCRRDGPPSEPAKPDSQVKLGSIEAQAT